MKFIAQKGNRLSEQLELALRKKQVQEIEREGKRSKSSKMSTE